MPSSNLFLNTFQSTYQEYLDKFDHPERYFDMSPGEPVDKIHSDHSGETLIINHMHAPGLSFEIRNQLSSIMQHIPEMNTVNTCADMNDFYKHIHKVEVVFKKFNNSLYIKHICVYFIIDPSIPLTNSESTDGNIMILKIYSGKVFKSYHQTRQTSRGLTHYNTFHEIKYQNRLLSSCAGLFHHYNLIVRSGKTITVDFGLKCEFIDE